MRWGGAPAAVTALAAAALLTAAPPLGSAGPAGHRAAPTPAHASLAHAAQRGIEAELRRLERSVQEHARGGSLDAAELRERLEVLRLAEGPLARRLETALCALAGTASTRPGDVQEVRVQRLVLEVLRSRMRGPHGAAARAHVERGILLRPLSASTEARAGAALALAPLGGTDPRPSFAADTTRAALLAAAGDPDPAVAALALDALVGDPTARWTLARAALAELRGEAPHGPGKQPAPRPGAPSPDRALDRLARHEAVERQAGRVDPSSPSAPAPPPPLLGPESGALASALVSAWLQADWRRASAAVRSATVMPAPGATGPLVEALELWNRRALVSPRGGGPPTGAVRVQGEIVAMLELHSGLSLGPSPARWRSWLARVGRGEAALVGAAPQGTQAEFFGLPLQSGAVAFVLDASGSMATPMGTHAGGSSGAVVSRFQAAQRELLGVLARSPDPIWFELVLFDSSARRYAPEPRLGTGEELEQLSQWLAAQLPAGGTRLGSGLSELWPAQPGSQRLPTSPCDTVVVLCDGATVEDGAYASAFLARGPLEDRVRFHALQIGQGPADAIETLARESGGQFLRIAR